MDLHESAERERSEPCSARTNPFTQDQDNISRKRQRIANGESRSRSVETTTDSDHTLNTSTPSESNDKAEPPQTPPQMPPHILPEPNSSKVTINLRTNRSLEAMPSSPPSPSEMIHDRSSAAPRVSVESESDALSARPAIETPSSSPSEPDSPVVEVVENDSDYDGRDPPVAVFGDDGTYEDPMPDFPYANSNETLAQTAQRIAVFLQYDEISDPAYFRKMSEWIKRYLRYASDHKTFYESYIKHQEMWMVLPDTISALSRRSRFFGPFLSRSREGRLAVSEMFFQYARLTGRFLEMDTRTLKQFAANRGAGQSPELGSYGFLSAYCFLVQQDEGAHIGRNLETHYNWDWDGDVRNLELHFKAAGGTLANLTKLAEGLATLLEDNPKLADHFTMPCRLAFRIVTEARTIAEERSSYQPDQVREAQSLLVQGYDFFEITSNCLETIIDKHVTHISPDSMLTHLNNLTTMARSTLSFSNPKTLTILEKFAASNPELAHKYIIKVISLDWKFGILRKLIISTQMQLRVIGVATMCTDLLHTYTTENRIIDASENPVLLYFARFLLRSQLVDYIVSIGSHPELINESNNIVGFLLATKTYTGEQTDMLWQTVMKSQDPRVVEAILRLLQKIASLFDLPGLTYLCVKVREVPLTAFTTAMRDFCQTLIHELAKKVVNETAGQMPTAIYELCIWLIREASVARDEAPLGYPDIQNFATTRLHHLLQYGPPDAGRRSLYEACMQDVASKSPTSSGSLCVIGALLQRNVAQDLNILATRQGLSKLIVEEVESTMTGDRTVTDQPTRINQASEARRDILLMIITQEPDTISPPLGERLWNVAVGCESKSVAAREIFWQILNTAAKKCSLDNTFLARCSRQYLPTLPPHCFTNGALEFARQSVKAWMEEVLPESHDTDQKFESQSLDQLWRMILTAPPNTIDSGAIETLVDLYVNSRLILSLPRSEARSIHLELMERCLNQLKGAVTQLKKYSDGASSESDEGMIIVASEGQLQEQELVFARSLAVLREFLTSYQKRPHFTISKPRPVIKAASPAIEGESMTIKYQSFEGDAHAEVRSLSLGKDNTGADLLASLQEATGFEYYKVYCDGREFDPDEAEICRSLDDLKLRGLILVHRRDDLAEVSPNSSGGKSLESEIARHFPDLWDYLGMHESVAQEIHHFLIKFPVYDRLLENLQSESVPSCEIFPTGQPYKSLYALHALRQSVPKSPRKQNQPEVTLTRPITLIVSGLLDDSAFLNCATNATRDFLALTFVDCLVHFLRKDLTLPSSINPIFNDALLDRLLELASGGTVTSETHHAVLLRTRSTDALLEVSTRSVDFWKLLHTRLTQSNLLRSILLEDSRPTIRKSTAKQISQKCTSAPNHGQVSSSDFVIGFWSLVSNLIQDAASLPSQSEETFLLAIALFERLLQTRPSGQDINDLIDKWGCLLLKHDCLERIGCYDQFDIVAQGLSKLLLSATEYMNEFQKSLSTSALGNKLFRKHLFPELSASEDSDKALVSLQLPILSPLTRQTLSDTVFNLVKDDEEQYKDILAKLATLVPYANIQDGPYVYELPFIFDRLKSIRSPTGYVGLRNLSNTCYLNSLFTQLFMNVSFREFMLNAHVADGANQQKLLAETQNLFSYMQNSFRRFIDPTNLACSIVTYDGGNIDVSIQMDVDEFYNLLFERWEGQMLLENSKREFKSFYGGQLVQQVKSKECPHISEREESFAAIQCDIKGKNSLEESLRAYVEGEIMEGDNKYKCSECDRHVDAVKRTCIKEVPDNLIFHLKRFEFNLRNMTRSKINEHFTFPRLIDMRPYKVEYLTENAENSPEDIFELVGVLVHSGTAESGHYYSYIREQPSTAGQDNWVEFNDESVTHWDATNMESACFGGFDYRTTNANGNDIHYDKSYSAYMLFYQRSSAAAQQNDSLLRLGVQSPVRVEIQPSLANHITMENEILMRKYCLYDPAHIIFVSRMLMHMHTINEGRCSASHAVEKLALTTALNHLDQVVSRTKELPQFKDYMESVDEVCQRCAECSRDFLEWFCDCPETMRQLILRNPDQELRIKISDSILAALNKVKVEASYAYGFGDDDESADELEGGDPQLIQRIAECLTKLWETFHQSCRAWPEYFGLLYSIADMGELEATLLLDHGFLRKSLEVISADQFLQLGQQYTRMLNIISKRIVSRPVSYDAVISLLCKLLQTCDLTVVALPDGMRRLPLAVNRESIPLLATEHHLLAQHWTRNEVHILTDKLLQLNQNGHAANSIIIMLLDWETDVDKCVRQAIATGLRAAAYHTVPFLNAAFVYCDYTIEDRSVAYMIQYVAKATHNLDNADGKEFIDFFQTVVDLPTNRSQISKDDILKAIRENLNWWAPALLTYYEAAVRMSTDAFIREIVLNNDGGTNMEDPHSIDDAEERSELVAQGARKLGIGCMEYIQEIYIRQRIQAVRVVMQPILDVIRMCEDYYGDPMTDLIASKFEELRRVVIPMLEKSMVEEAEDEVSEWEASDGEGRSSSEPMDSIIPSTDDMQDADIQV